LTSTRQPYGFLVLSLSFVLVLVGCKEGPTDVEMPEEPLIDQALNGAWVAWTVLSPSRKYINELRFNNGRFEYWWEDDLQQRGVYDTQDGILTVTIQNTYGPRLLDDYSSPYSIAGDTLTWGGGRLIKQ